MPELPEVETIRRQLHVALEGRRILAVELWLTGREQPAGKAFISALEGRLIVAVERRAKLLIWRFDDGSSMVGHLKMTGKFLLADVSYKKTKHDRARFLTDGAVFIWSDVRKFGYVKLFSNAQELENVLALYGPEPLDVPAQVLADCLLTPKTRKVKAVLLDQTVIAGVGNIYADEACHRAGIRPTRRLGSLSAVDRLRLAKEIQTVLKESIAEQGTSANDYVDANGEKGGFLKLLRVYGRGGLACRTCASPIKKIVLAGRGTHYCSNCQK